MKIALPVKDNLTIYKDNPHTAPKFAIYSIEKLHETIEYSLLSIIENPMSKLKDKKFEDGEIGCNCSVEKQDNLEHKCEHYSLLEILHECSYLLASKYCKNTQSSLKKAGIKIFKIPTIISRIDMAIKNFIIGASLASKIKNIHHAS